MVLATQALGDLVGSPFASTLLEQIPTRILLPNPRALEPVTRQIYASLGLGPALIDLVGSAVPKRDYVIQGRSGVQLVDLALGEVALSVLTRSTPRDQALIDRTEPDRLLDVLLNTRPGAGRGDSHAAA